MQVYENTAKYIKEKYDVELSELTPDYRLSDGNQKLQQSGIESFNLIPIIHCPLAGSCKAFCYATVGNQAFRSGQLRRARAFLATLQDDFVQQMIAQITTRKKIKAVRVHDSGDFYDFKYMKKWFEIAAALPDMQFYAYTKMIPLVKMAHSAGLVPPNFRLIQSIGGMADGKIQEDLPHARIFHSLEDLQEAGYADASETDDVAAFGTTNKVGLVIHGARRNAFGRAG